MTGGKAHGADRQYQVACRDVLKFRNTELVPWLDDGIDVPFDLRDTRWTFDVALRDPSGALLVAECRRTTSPVKQEAIASFADKLRSLRRTLGIPVTGIFLTKTSHQIGAVRKGQYDRIRLAILEGGAVPPGFHITFLRYDAEREKKCRDIIVHAPPGSCVAKGMPVTLTHGRVFGESESR